jgi:hypothetical protein
VSIRVTHSGDRSSFLCIRDRQSSHQTCDVYGIAQPTDLPLVAQHLLANLKSKYRRIDDAGRGRRASALIIAPYFRIRRRSVG